MNLAQTKPPRDGLRATDLFKASIPAVITLFAIAFLVGAKAPVSPADDLDSSWRLGLAWAHLLDLDFGPDIAFTYGPLGFSGSPLVSIPLGVSAMIVNTFFAWIFLTSLFFASQLRFRSTRLSITIVGIGAIFVMASRPWMVSMTACLTVLVLASTTELRRTSRELLLALGAALCAASILVKFTAVVLIPVVGLIAAFVGARERRWNRLSTSAASFGMAFILIWIALRQPIGGIWPFLRDSIDLTRGYVDMSLELAGVAWGYSLLIGSAALVLHLVLRHMARNVGWAISILLITYWAARIGFVRHDEGHQTHYFVWLVPIALIVILQGEGIENGPRLTATRLQVGALAIMAIIGAYGPVLADFPRALVEQSRRSLQVASLTVASGARAEGYQQSRADIRIAADLPQRIARELSTGNWHAEPIDIAVLWAYQADWAPLPTLQAYTAYSKHLDERNARALMRDSPKMLERIGFAIDGRRALWESPRTRLVVACQYSVTVASRAWQVLERSMDSCSPPVALGDPYFVEAGESVAVPELPPGPYLIVMVVEIRDSGIGRITRLLWKDYRPPLVRVDDSEYRLPRGHLGSDLILCGGPAGTFPEPVPQTCPTEVSLSATGSIHFKVVARNIDADSEAAMATPMSLQPEAESRVDAVDPNG